VAVLQPITVHSADDPLINAGRTGPAQSIPEETIARLPVLNRDFSQLALVSPQVVISPSGGLSIAGQPDRLNALQIDGATNNELLGGSGLGGVGTPGADLGARTLSVEAIQELQVISAPYDVRFGNFAAGLVNAVTKSGTNRFEGSLSAYFSSRGLVGKDSEGGRGADFETKEVDATLGGPIVHDRAAFFVDAGIQRRVFPEAAPLIGTDTTGGADSAGVGVRYASAIRFGDILRNVYGVEPGDFGAFPLQIPAGNLFGKVTLQLDVNSRLEVSHTYSHSFPRIAYDRAFDFYSLTSSVFGLPVTTNATRLTWTAGFGSRYANELVAARLHEVSRCSPASAFPTIGVYADRRGLFAGSICLPAAIRDDEGHQTILELTDNLTLAAGAHRFTLGTHNELIRLSTLPFLDYGFGAGWTFLSLDSLEQRLPYAYKATLRGAARPAGPLSNPRIFQFGAYLQDQWNPDPHLTVTAGLRMDVPYLSRRPVLNPSLLSSPLAVDNTLTPSGNILWSPRLGVNYDLAGNGKTFLRGGVGLFAGRPAYKWFVAVDAHTGLEAYSLSCTGPDVPAFTIDPANQPTTCAGGALPSTPLVNIFDPAFRFPRNLKLALGADHRLPSGIVGTIDFLYTRAINQYDLLDLNLSAPSATTGEGGRTMYGTIDSMGMATPTRLDSALGPVIQVRNARGNHAFSVTTQLQKRFANGTEIGGSYTYGRSRDRLSAATDNTDGDVDFTALDGTLEHRQLTTSLWEVPHRVTFLVTANLPLGFRGSLFYEGLSGTPFTYFISGDVNADGFGGDDIVYVPRDIRPGGDVSLVVLDEATGSLVPAPPGEYDRLARVIAGEHCLREQRGRIMRRNSCRFPWTNHTQARFSKVFPTFRGHALELTLDVFNLLHLLNSDWGLARGSDDHLLELVGFDAARGRGVYRMLEANRRFIDDDSSRWRMQLGAQYRF
jgi:outer membrane receptor protein involved in Fe transport